MKKLSLFGLVTALMIISVVNVNAQNRYTFGDGKTQSSSLVVSDNMNVWQAGEHAVVCSFGEECKRPERTDAATHTLTINTVDGYRTGEIHVVSGDNYHNYNMDQSTFTDIVEEGYYDILVLGLIETPLYYILGIITYNQVPVFEDITIDASYNECVYSIDYDAVNEDGDPISGLNILSLASATTLVWLDDKWSVAYQDLADPYYHTPLIRFNEIDERSRFSCLLNIHTDNQTVYSINFPTMYGASGNVVFENDADHFIKHQEYYHLSPSETSYYHLDYWTIYDEIYALGILTWDGNVLFDPNKPLTVFSDNRIDDPGVFTDYPQTILLPAVFESESYSYSTSTYNNIIAPFGFYYNNEEQLVSEPFGRVSFYSTCLPSAPKSPLNYIPETPAKTINPKGAKLYYGERTPMSYYQANSIKADESPTGKNIFRPSFISIGENSCQRIGDRSANAVIKFNDMEIFNDSLYKFQGWCQIDVDGAVTMDINNTHLLFDGVERYNQTHIEFDFNKEDVTVPTTTILQVMNESGEERIELLDVASSYINFAAGDFSPKQGSDGSFDHMHYDGSPSTIEVSYAITDPVTGYRNEWMSLDFSENGNMFHETYGNHFTIELSQLPPDAAGHWVSLKFVLTDEAGNLMQQEMSNVFHVGQIESVEELVEHSCTVFPNPFTTEVKVFTRQNVNGLVHIQVYNMLGEQIFSKTESCTNIKEFTITGRDWKPGIYFYTISTEKGLLEGKIVKE